MRISLWYTDWGRRSLDAVKKRMEILMKLDLLIMTAAVILGLTAAARSVVFGGVSAILLEVSLQVMRTLDVAIHRVQFGAA